MNIARRYSRIFPRISQNKLFSSEASINSFEIPQTFVNRNPRNLEKLRIGYKPDGYHVEKAGKIYWHKLLINESTKYVTASIHHFKNGQVLVASTSEWPIKKRLYRYNDVSACINLGRVLGERCLKAGIIEVSCFIEPNNPEGRIANFLKAFEQQGIALKEPPQYKPSRPWDQFRPEKPWEVLD
ncbi:hypothetical protein WA026_016709 [Henosepilachna vigintioctopunctata]|uniref:Large ribosomal subunit protein uL18m n=1 Tax=Henosepilachna vigintioctopunctata TaxID=420089 RepID=A0AAW1UTE3_9CUCU